MVHIHTVNEKYVVSGTYSNVMLQLNTTLCIMLWTKQGSAQIKE